MNFNYLIIVNEEAKWAEINYEKYYQEYFNFEDTKELWRKLNKNKKETFKTNGLTLELNEEWMTNIFELPVNITIDFDSEMSQWVSKYTVNIPDYNLNNSHAYDLTESDDLSTAAINTKVEQLESIIDKETSRFTLILNKLFNQLKDKSTVDYYKRLVHFFNEYEIGQSGVGRETDAIDDALLDYDIFMDNDEVRNFLLHNLSDLIKTITNDKLITHPEKDQPIYLDKGLITTIYKNIIDNSTYQLDIVKRHNINVPAFFDVDNILAIIDTGSLKKLLDFVKNNVDDRKTFLNILQHAKYKESDILKHFKFNEESVDRYITLDNKAAADELISNFDNTASRFGYLIL